MVCAANTQIASVPVEPVEVIHTPCDNDLSGSVDVGDRETTALARARRNNSLRKSNVCTDQRRHTGILDPCRGRHRLSARGHQCQTVEIGEGARRCECGVLAETVARCGHRRRGDIG